ncbi:MAG: response regulator [Chloroflexi bacterium]|nr:MAG: response regulator [Chloroflexota bacterium]
MARILIVEDDPNNLDVAQRIVRAAGHEAIAATDGLMGLEVARRKHPDAILMDLLLPQLDGWSVTRALRAEPWAQGVPIIAVSALAMQADRALALEAGCDDFVSKPYAPAELRAVLSRYFPVGGATRAVRTAPDTTRQPEVVLGRALVVDDEPGNIELLTRRLRAIGCETFEASSGEQALEVAKRELPDVVLLDVMMPGMDGWETCRRLREDPITAGIQVIFVTARDHAEDIAKGFEVGGMDYVPKPFEPLELTARVRSAIIRKKLRDDLKKKNEDLERLERSRQELIGMLGHDIRNLANSVIAFLELVGHGQLTPDRPEFGQLLQLSEANVTELLRMVNALLDVYRMEEGRLEMMPQVVPLAELAQRSIAQMRPEAAAKSVRLAALVPEDASVFVDDALIVRVLTNLLSNAVKHTPSGGDVRIEARPAPDAPDAVLVRVVDNGPGIPLEDAPHIFDRFYQGRGRKRGGSGLGLAFCKLAVELHGGKITVANGGQPGAIVEFTLPVAAQIVAKPALSR